MTSCRYLASWAAAVSLATAGCGRAPAPTTQAPTPRATPEVRYNSGDNRGPSTTAGGGASVPDRPANSGGGGAPRANASQRQRQMELLERIRKADPQFSTIDKAVMNEENDLALILDRRVQMDDVPKLLKAMLVQMGKEFPGEDLDVVAYAPSQPPLKIGTGHLDARTREMTYTAAARR